MHESVSLFRCIVMEIVRNNYRVDEGSNIISTRAFERLHK